MSSNSCVPAFLRSCVPAFLRSCALALLALIVLPAEAHAQVERVVHLWVDPLYGDDLRANTWNPGGSNNCLASEQTPVDVLEAGTNAVLLHASNPFKTVTAAVRSIEQNGPLPITSPTTGVTWRHAIIHLLPGRYARNVSRSPDNALPGNGETFPIRLPRHVSIQGTSVLNTVFELKDGTNAGANTNGPFFEFGVFVDPSTGLRVLSSNPAAEPYDGEDCFINGVCFVGAQTTLPGDPARPREQHAAIYLCSEIASAPTIVNCVFTTNEIGILVNAPNDDPGSTGSGFHDETFIINNTFVWNRIGVWNGQSGDFFRGIPTPAQAIGRSRLLMVNNLFDGVPNSSAIPCVPFGTAFPFNSWPGNFGPIGTAADSSDFEGVAEADMRVATAAGSINFNAFEQGAGPSGPCNFFDLNVVLIPGLPPTVNRPGTAVPNPTASRNLSPITGTNGAPQCGGLSTNRGVLFIRDLICHGRVSGVWSQDPAFDGSPLDFRLAPSVGLAGAGAPGQAPTTTNPLIDAGFSGPFPMTMENGLVRTTPPGFLVLTGNSQNTWPFHAFQLDGEGFGNPRVMPNPFGENNPPAAVDIGADEVGGLIVAGYTHGTTAFFKHAVSDDRVTGGAPRARNNSEFVVLGPVNVDLSPDQGQPWYRSVIVQPAGLFPWRSAGTNCTPFEQTQFSTWFSDWNLNLTPTSGFNYGAPTVEITPHLPPDIHPWWSLTAFQATALTTWQSCVGAGNYNPLLYVDPTAERANPPGTLSGFVGMGLEPHDFSFLDGFPFPGLPPFARWRHWNTCTANANTGLVAPLIDGFDVFGRGGSATSGFSYVLPGTKDGDTLRAIRFSLEFDGDESTTLSAATKNIQSFMVWNTDAAPSNQ